MSKGKELAPVTVNVCKWCDDGRHIFEDVADEAPVFQYQIVHDTRPSVTFQFLTHFRQFLPTHDVAIQNLEDLANQRRIRVGVSGSNQESDETGTKPWRVVLYGMESDPRSVIHLIAAFVEWKSKSPEYAEAGVPDLLLTQASASVFQNCGLSIDWNVAAPGSLSPHPFDAPPPKGRRHLLLQMEDNEQGGYDFMFFGGTWAYRAEFDKACVDSGFVDAGDRKEYVRLLKNIEDNDDGRARIGTIMQDVLKNQCVFLIVECEEANCGMLKWMKSLETVHFRE